MEKEKKFQARQVKISPWSCCCRFTNDSGSPILTSMGDPLSPLCLPVAVMEGGEEGGLCVCVCE